MIHPLTQRWVIITQPGNRLDTYYPVHLPATQSSRPVRFSGNEFYSNNSNMLSGKI